MADLTLSRSGELDVTQIAGDTPEGKEFVDAILVEPMMVVDSGRVIVPNDVVEGLMVNALASGLTVAREAVL